LYVENLLGCLGFTKDDFPILRLRLTWATRSAQQLVILCYSKMNTNTPPDGFLMLAHASKKMITSIIVFLASTTSYSDSNQYLCETKHSVGFIYVEEKNDWEISPFLNEKYILSKCSDIDKKTYSIENCGYKFTKMGDQFPVCGCEDTGYSIICAQCPPVSG
jgi:hypothetical protein